MSTMIRWAAIALCAALASCAVNPVPNARACSHLLTLAGGTCSAVSVGTQTLLTASHCIAGDTLRAVDGKPTRVLWVAQDGQDHTLIGQTVRFAHWIAKFAPAVEGEPVFVIGNPWTLRDNFRRGYVSGTERAGRTTATLYELPIYVGDSGAAILDMQGRIVGVVSATRWFESDGLTLTYGMSLPLAFTAAQMSMIR